MSVFDIIGYIIIGLGVFFILAGIAGIFRFKDFYIRTIVASKIDSMGVFTLMIGIAFVNGLSFFTAKLILIAVVMMVLSPLVAHAVARSAYMSGYLMEDNSNEYNSLPAHIAAGGDDDSIRS